MSTSFVATLISAPGIQAIDDSVLARARAELPGAGAPAWLAPGEAADLVFVAEEPAKAIGERVRAALGTTPVDVVVQPAAGRRKGLLIADMDSTMIGQECIDELAAEVGIKAHVSAITERAMRGELAFEPALRERVGLLKGVDADVVDKIIAERITLTPGGRTLIRTMQAHGGYCALVSGGFTVFTSRIAAMIGFDENRANILETVVEGGRAVLAGTVREPILGQDAKRDSLHELAAMRGLPLDATLAVGDGANDLVMIRDAGLGVAFRAKPKVAAEADARIEHADLTALLYAQGYASDAFVSG